VRDKTVQEIAAAPTPPNTVRALWKRQAIEGMAGVILRQGQEG
jgi:hypothetical protein